jgi:carbon monoxide dehydrogenase subunit G
MASVHHELHLDGDATQVWAALRDFGSAERLFPGVVTATRLQGRERVVTFADGSTVREVLVTRDDDARRLVYAAVDSAVATHHSAAFAVREGATGGAVVTWTTDVLPDALAEPVGERMRAGAAALRRALGARP